MVTSVMIPVLQLMAQHGFKHVEPMRTGKKRQLGMKAAMPGKAAPKQSRLS